MTILQRIANSTAAAALASLLAACGGGSDTPGGTPTPAPAPAPAPVPSATAPVLLGETLSVSANGESTLSVLANDSHPDKLALELVSIGTPSHGSAAVKNGAISYTPAPGYWGADKISYVARAVGGSATATAEVTVAVGVPLRLSGKIAVANGVTTTVVVTVGTKSYTQNLTDTRQYDVPVVLDAPEQMVSVTAQATSAGSQHIKLITLAGDARSLYEASAGNAVLSDNQFADLNVNLFTTGKYLALMGANGGAAPLNQAALAQANAKINSFMVYETAGALRLATGALPSGEAMLPLPAGISNTLQLILDRAAYKTFFSGMIVDAVRFVHAKEALRKDATQQSVPAIALDRARTLTLASRESETGALAGAELRLQPDGNAQLYVEGNPHAAHWTRTSDALTVTLSSPYVYYVSVNDVDSADFTVTSIKFKQLAGGANRGEMSMTTFGTVQFLNPPARPDAPYEETRTYSFNAWDSVPPLTAQDIAGKTLAGMPILSATPDVYQEKQARISFAANGTASMLEFPAVTANWSIVDGKLRVAFADGTVQELARIRNLGAGEQDWLVRYTALGGQHVFSVNMAEVQPGLSFTSPAMAAQTWSSLGPLSDLYGAYFIKLLADQSGSDLNVRPDGSASLLYPNSWALDTGRLVVSVYRRSNGARVGVCPAAETCTLFSRRDWTLLRDDGHSITVLDTYLKQGYVQTRVIYYERIAP